MVLKICRLEKAWGSLDMFNRTRKGNALPFAGLSKNANVDEGEDKHDDVEHDKKWSGNGPVPMSIKIRLGIHYAENLVAADVHGTSDPLVKVYWHHNDRSTLALALSLTLVKKYSTKIRHAPLLRSTFSVDFL